MFVTSSIVGVCVWVCVLVLVGVWVCVLVGVWVCVLVGVCVGVWVAVGVNPTVTEGVGVCVGVLLGDTGNAPSSTILQSNAEFWSISNVPSKNQIFLVWL